MADAVASLNPNSVEVGQEAIEPSPLPPPKTVRPPGTACLAHPGQALLLYCVECKLPVCRQCTVVGHNPPKHTVSDIDNVAGGPRARIRELVGLFEREREKYEQTMQVVEERGVDISVAVTRARENIEKATEAMIADVRKKQQQLLFQVEFIAGNRQAEIKRLLAEMQGVLDEVRDVVPKIMGDIEDKDDATILALHRKIKAGQDRLQYHPLPSIEVIDNLGFLKFSPEKTPAFNLHLGDLLEDEQWCLDLKFGKFGSRVGEFNCARGVALSPDGDMAIAEQRNNRTTVYNTDGTYKLSMTGKASGKPERGDRDVAFLPDGRCLIVGKTSNVDVYDRNGGYLNYILTPAKNPWSLAVDAGGTVYLGDVQEKLIYIIVDCQVVRSFNVANQPVYLAVDNNGRIMVSNHSSKRVDILSVATGDTLFSIASKSIDPSNMVSPWGGCFGPDGSLFIPFYISDPKASERHGQVHEFGPGGRHLGCVVRGLNYPREVDFTRDGRLIVVEGSVVKLYRKV
ncbi:uncharacterized protein LOC110981428 isoform X2 [Acanthaster planci]|nr:uncharacterized protein LOC110981428 isoform X2 [Acanthaster planci]